MSIVTKTGDDGTTGLMFNRRVPKCDARIEACGCVDELNGALGLARAAASHDFIRGQLLPIQQDLIAVMGEIATMPDDRAKYLQAGYATVTPELTKRLEATVAEIEALNIRFKGWALPGDNPSSAALDFARTVCRRAERRVVALCETDPVQNPELQVYLNRLADLLWLMARWVEMRSCDQPDEQRRS